MVTVDMLRDFGANVDEGLGRCMGSEAIYLKLVTSITSEKNFDMLKQAIESYDLGAAFEAAHALKGVAGNLALTPIFEKVSELTELLRARTEMDYTDLLNEIMLLKEKLAGLCA